MRDDYLWDRSGEPDPDIQKLEAALGQFRSTRPAPQFPHVARPEPRTHWFLPLFRWPSWTAAAAAMLVAAGIFGFLFLQPKPPALTRWELTKVEGAARVGTSTIGKPGTERFRIGQVLETDNNSKASIRAEQTGEIDLEPGTRLRFVNSSAGRSKLTLERGGIHVAIWAPPGEFVVDTPSAIAVDLGCVYSLHVDDSGDGILRTSLGWVGFKSSGRESFIPAGAACPARKKTGPGTPYFENASQPFREALAKLDLQDSPSEERAAALRTVLTSARKNDAFTLWHLLPRVPDSERGPVYDRLAELVPPPASVTRDGILRGDQKMLDLWWNALGLGDISLWRHWERSWSQQDLSKN